jgi:KDO2-lipid IV(A) lauroyltransferase
MALRNYAKYLLEYSCLPAVRPEEVRKRVAFQGWENLGKALEAGKGAILVGLHQGYWEIAGGAVVLGGHALNVVVESLPWRKLDEFVQSRRRCKWMNVIAMENGVGEMIEALRRNEHLVLLIDIPNADKGVQVKFCGAVMKMPRGAATLALKTGAKVTPMASVRLPDNTFLTIFGECIDFQPSGSVSKDVRALTQEIMNCLEPYIKQHPEHYYMFRCMWPKAAQGCG